MHASQNNIAAYLFEIYSSYKIDIVAASGTDNIAVDGATIDRQGYQSLVGMIIYNATLTATKTISFTITQQESDDDSTWATATSVQAKTVAATGETGGSTEVGIVTFDVNLAPEKRYVRYVITADLSAVATDTADWHCAITLGGADIKPAV